jgi:hypothetical protein
MTLLHLPHRINCTETFSHFAHWAGADKRPLSFPLPLSTVANKSSVVFLVNLNTRCSPKLTCAADHAFPPGE